MQQPSTDTIRAAVISLSAIVAMLVVAGGLALGPARDAAAAAWDDAAAQATSVDHADRLVAHAAARACVR